MMRAVRFASQLDFDIEADTFDGIVANVARIDIISPERITDELNKIILSPEPSYGFKLLYHAGLLEKIFSEFVALYGVEDIAGKSHKDNFYHTLQVLDNVSQVSTDLWLRWAAILHDIAKPATKRFNEKSGWTFHGHEDKGARMVPKIFRRMKLPLNEHMDYVKKLVRLHLRPIALVKDDITDSAIRRLLFDAGNDIDDLMKLCKADITSKNHEKVKKYLNNFKRVEEKLRSVEQRDSLKNFQPPITGKIIMDTFGIKPGREIGDIKDAIREAILEGKIPNNYNDAFNMMLTLGKQKGLKSVNKE
jgi:putative nucleotidyltransferase with HDIG domain